MISDDLKSKFSGALNELRKEIDDFFRYCEESTYLPSASSMAEVYGLINQIVSTQDELKKIENFQRKQYGKCDANDEEKNSNNEQLKKQLHQYINGDKKNQLTAMKEMVLVILAVKFYNGTVPNEIIKSLAEIPNTDEINKITKELLVLIDGDIASMKKRLRGIE